VRLWDPSTGKELCQLQGDLAQVCCLAFSPDGKTVVAADHSPIRIWEVATGKEVGRLGGSFPADGQQPPPRKECEAPGRPPPAGDPPLGEDWGGRPVERRVFEGHAGRVYTVSFSPDGKTLASAGGDVLIWDMARRRKPR